MTVMVIDSLLVNLYLNLTQKTSLILSNSSGEWSTALGSRYNK